MVADWVEDAAPHRLRQSSDPKPATGWTKIPRDEHDRIAAIPERYRTGLSPIIVEMDRAAKDAVDAAGVISLDNETIREGREYVYALKKQMRRELNEIRRKVDECSDAMRTRNAKPRPAALGDLTGGTFSASIRSRLEEL